MISVGNATPGRVPAQGGVPALDQAGAGVATARPRPARRGLRWFGVLRDVLAWMHRGYTSVNASDMAAAVAFNTLIALVPMLLLLVAIGGLFLQNDTVLHQARLAIERIVPGDTADEAFTAALTARRNPGWIGVISFFSLAWVGTGLVSCLARSMNRIYGAPSSGYINEKQRGFLVLLIFSFLFLIASVATILPSFFINQDLPDVFERWLLATVQYQLIGYGIGFATSILLFFTIYRVIPNAGQRAPDVWPGTMTSALLYVLVSQIFPIYIRLTGGGNRYGQILGFVSLLVLSLLALAHIILFGAYINATWQRRRRLRHRERVEVRQIASLPKRDQEDE